MEQPIFTVMLKLSVSGDLAGVFHLDAKDSEAVDLLERALEKILKLPENELEEIAVRLKLLTENFKIAALEAKLALMESKLAELKSHDNESRG